MSRASARLARATRGALLAVLTLAALLTAGNLLAGCLAGRPSPSMPRDADTGLLVGAEPRTLGPEGAPGAALFIHGFAGGGSNFADMPDRLAEAGWRVRVMRLPGHGTTARDFAEQRAEDYIATVTKEYEALVGEHDVVAVVGHSMGGALAAWIAENASPDAVVLAAPYFRVTRRAFYVLPVETWVRLMGPFVRWVYKGDAFKQVNRPEAEDEVLSYRWIPLNAARTLADLGDRVRDPDALQRIDCPVLVIHSTGDVAASYEAARAAFRQMGTAEKEFVTLERSNHHIFWDYEREEVAEAVLKFLGAPRDWLDGDRGPE